MKKIYLVISYVFISLFFFNFGKSFGDYMGTKLAVNIKSKLVKNEFFAQPKYDGPKPEIDKYINIKSKTIAKEKRKALINLIWGSSKLPQKSFNEINNESEVEKYSSLKEIHSVKKISYEIGNNLFSRAYVFSPKKYNDKAVIFHKGHGDGGDLWANKRQLKAFLNEGFLVLVLEMPSYGNNPKIFVEMNNIGYLKLDQHDKYKFLDSKKNQSPLRYFVEPVIYAINYLQINNIQNISLVGISGGAWTVDLVSAIDERINNTFSIAGPHPLAFYEFIYCEGNFYKKKYLNDAGHYEYFNNELPKILSIFDQYILSSFSVSNDKNRNYHQIKLSHENGSGYCSEHYKLYLNKINARLSELGNGQLHVYDEKSYKHEFSKNAINYIIQNI